MIKLVFWKLLENKVFLWECCPVIFVKDAYSLLPIAYRLWLSSLRASSEFIYESESMASLC